LKLKTDRGFVLSAFPSGETDKWVRLMTREAGKVRAYARGVRKPKSKLAPALEFFTESTFVLHSQKRGDSYGLSQAKVLNGHPDLKKDLSAIALLQLLADILLGCLPEGEPHPVLFDGVRDLLKGWETHPEHREQILAAFVLRFLTDGGYPLELTDCAQCGETLSGKKALLVPHRGGALCPSCGGSGPPRLQVTPQSMAWLKKLLELPLARVTLLKLSSSQARSVLLTTLEYLERTFEKPLKTLDYYLSLPTKSLSQHNDKPF
jgi:DNA repair protein RecO (recombination protein O)